MIATRVALGTLLAVAVSAASQDAAAKATGAAQAPASHALDFGAPETDKAFLQSDAKARFASALTANAHSQAMWRFGGNFQPQVRLPRLGRPFPPPACAALAPPRRPC